MLGTAGILRDGDRALYETYLALGRDHPRKIWPWLATIAANVCIDIQRSSDDGPEREAAARIRAEILRKALKRLPSRYRTYMYLVDYEGWTYAEIGKWNAVSVGRWEALLLRAREALKAQVKRVAKAMGQCPLPTFIQQSRSCIDIPPAVAAELVNGSV